MRHAVLVVAVGVSLGGAPIASAQLEPAPHVGSTSGAEALATGVFGGALSIGGELDRSMLAAAARHDAGEPRRAMPRRAELAVNLCDTGCARAEVERPAARGDEPQRATVVAPATLRSPTSTTAGIATGGRY